VREKLPPDADLPAAIEGGLAGSFGLIEGQMLAALDGEIEVDPKNADAQLGQLAALARALDRKFAADAGQGEPVDLEQLLAQVGGAEADMFPSAEELRSRGRDEDGYFVSNGGERLLVAIFPECEGDEVDDYAPTVERRRALRDGLANDEVTISFTGLPFLVVDE